jgi:hypothetical protein
MNNSPKSPTPKFSNYQIQKSTITDSVNLLFKIEYLCDCMNLKNGFVLYGNLFPYGTNDVYRERPDRIYQTG